MLHHNAYEAQQRIVAEMTRVLRPGGTFICSTPNIAYTAHPPYHVKEHRPEEFFALLGATTASSSDSANISNRSIGRRVCINGMYARRSWIPRRASASKKRSRNFCAARRRPGAPPSPSANWRRSAPADYRVQPYRRPKWLRIMVAVAVKER